MIDRILPGYGAIDIGQEKIFVACSGEETVRSFATFSADLELAAEYLLARGITRVAMEATGVYWIPLHDLLESRGMKVTVFNGAHARNLPGRKSDVQDCQWHGMLHSHGLLVSCFIPPEEIRQLRCYYRLREDHLGIASEHIQHMQRALDLMNVRLHVVISQLHGVSGLRVIRAILAGERDPVALSELCDGQILQKKRAEVIKSLRGRWQEHHLFALRQALESYEFCLRQMAACDREIEALLQRVTADRPPQSPAPGQKVKVVRHNAPQIEGLHRLLITLSGGPDATQLPGISPLGFMKLLGEIGTDLSAWKSAKHFTSWLGLSPGSSQSGKRRKRVPRKKTVAGQIFREAGLSIARSKHLAMGAAYRRLKAAKGSPIAIVAIARKLAVLYYNLFTKGLAYVEEGVRRYEERYRQQTLRYLEKKAKAFGFALTPTTAAC
jgi:transposase